MGVGGLMKSEEDLAVGITAAYELHEFATVHGMIHSDRKAIVVLQRHPRAHQLGRLPAPRQHCSVSE